MGMTTKSIQFFTDTIKIVPHTATSAAHIGRLVSLRRFANGQRLSLEQVQETGELIARRGDGEFIHGPEV